MDKRPATYIMDIFRNSLFFNPVQTSIPKAIRNQPALITPLAILCSLREAKRVNIRETFNLTCLRFLLSAPQACSEVRIPIPFS